MTPPAVHIRREALEMVLAVAVEPFKRECGRSIGRKPSKTRPYYLITKALGNTCVRKRSNTATEEATRSSDRLEKLYKEAPTLFPVIGSFRSHPEWGECVRELGLSQPDIHDLTLRVKKNGPLVDVVVVISSRQRGQAFWAAQPDGSIKGSLGSYNFQVGAFTLDEGQNPQMLKIVAPSALKAFNRVYHIL